MSKVLIIGATSAIAEATARCFAAGGDSLYLVGRREERLRILAEDLKARGAPQVQYQVMDVNEIERHQQVLADAEAALGGLTVALLAHGTLPDQNACQQDVDCLLQEFRTNALSSIALLTLLAERFERQGRGTIAAITSVAADRGRQSNYVYGAAKAAVETFMEGLRQRLHKADVKVVTIKPGFVDTPMTRDFKKGLLWAKPERVASRIHRAIKKGGDVVYVPLFWWPIMTVIRMIPRPIFKAIRL